MKDAKGGRRTSTRLNTSIKSNESEFFNLWPRMTCADADGGGIHMNTTLTLASLTSFILSPGYTFDHATTVHKTMCVYRG